MIITLLVFFKTSQRFYFEVNLKKMYQFLMINLKTNLTMIHKQNLYHFSSLKLFVILVIILLRSKEKKYFNYITFSINHKRKFFKFISNYF